jgi:hypothetical protein
MTNNSSQVARELPRHAIHGDIDVYDRLRDVYVGRLINIHTQGMMLLGDVHLDEDRLYTLELHLPTDAGEVVVVTLGVDCLWVRADDTSGKFWSGFSLIDISLESARAIVTLIERFGEMA